MAKGIAAQKGFDPSKYEPLGYFYIGANEEIKAEYFLEHQQLAAKLGLELFESITAAAGSCDSCGTLYSHGAVVKHSTAGNMLATGQICAQEYFGLRSIAAFKAQEARRAVERQRIKVMAADVLTANPGLTEALETDHGIARDLTRKLWAYGNLSAKQIGLAFDLQKQAAENDARIAADKLIEYCPVPKGTNVAIEGLVLSEQWRENHGYPGSSHKMLLAVDTPSGRFKLWGTVPSKISGNVTRGDTVALTVASLEPSRDDDTFGFYKRPKNASIVLCHRHKERT